ncbi:protein of unknown function [Bradyrhizobium vignae]|uniref:Uncharacterized protein n=1 Tax=Bradyrhizobium vignae TaxID=1549949 RepID=A0A2U3PWG7_9BRAD|nr:protein of unknown function [Bradyrhizobium vignae]
MPLGHIRAGNNDLPNQQIEAIVFINYTKGTTEGGHLAVVSVRTFSADLN